MRNWTRVTTTGAISGRTGPAMSYDPVRQRVVLFGGGDASIRLGDTWEYTSATGTWTQRVVTGPPVRSFACMAYDPVRNVSVLFGGYNGGAPYNDTWEWNGTAWTQRLPVTSPPVRYFFGCWWDAARARIALFGGVDGNSTPK